MCSENVVTSVRLSGRLASDVDKFAVLHSMSRTAAINFLLTKGLLLERLNDIDNGKSALVERDLIDDKE